MPAEPWDWYVDAGDMVRLCLPHLLQQQRQQQQQPPQQTAAVEVVVPGVGYSLVPSELARRGFACVTSMDVDESAVAAQTEWARREARDAAADAVVVDASDAEASGVPARSFDAVVDKACLDAVLAAGPDGARRARRYLAECARLVKPGGVMLVLTHGTIEAREPMLRQAGWDVREVKRVPKPVVPGVDMGTSEFFTFVACCLAAPGPHSQLTASSRGAPPGLPDDDEDII